jgi:hypothetical protein
VRRTRNIDIDIDIDIDIAILARNFLPLLPATTFRLCLPACATLIASRARA